MYCYNVTILVKVFNYSINLKYWQWRPPVSIPDGTINFNILQSPINETSLQTTVHCTALLFSCTADDTGKDKGKDDNKEKGRQYVEKWSQNVLE